MKLYAKKHTSEKWGGKTTANNYTKQFQQSIKSIDSMHCTIKNKQFLIQLL